MTVGGLIVMIPYCGRRTILTRAAHRLSRILGRLLYSKGVNRNEVLCMSSNSSSHA